MKKMVFTKRVLSLVLCLAMVLGMVPFTVFAEEKEIENSATTILYGDADTDGVVDLQDVLLIEKYIADHELQIGKIQADVNADGYINATDVQMVKDYLVENRDNLTPELVTITFDTAGGNEIEPMQVGKGYGIVKPLPTPSKADAVFIGWKKSDGSDFRKEEAIFEDITLVAQYDSIPTKEELFIDSFALTDCKSDVSFLVKGEFDSADAVKEATTLVPKDGSDPVEIRVTDNGNGTYTIAPTVSFTPGSSYSLTLSEGLSFVDREATIRTANFIIRKEESDKLYFNEDVKFIKDTDEMTYTIDGENGNRDVLESALLNNEEGNEDITGTFAMSGSGIAVGDIVCIYENEDPRNRDYTKNDYQDDSLAYVRITAVNGDEYSFESLSDEDADEVLMMPDSIPFSVQELPTGETGTVNKLDYDAGARMQLGIAKAPEYKIGDFLIFYTGEFEQTDENTEVVYGQVTEADDTTVTYKTVTKEEIDSFMGMFVRTEIRKEDVLKSLDQEAFLQDIAEQVEKSGFAEEATGYMLQSAMYNEKVKEAMLNIGMTEEEFAYYADTPNVFRAPTMNVARTKVRLEDSSIVPSMIVGNQFENGIGVRLDIHAIFSIDAKMPNNKISSLKIDLFASFEQEVAVGIDVNVEDQWKWYLCIPVLDELSCYTSVDLQSYTYVSVGATIYTVSDETMKKWTALADTFENDPYIYALVRMFDQKAIEVQKLKKDTDKYLEKLEELEGILEQIPKINVDGQEYSYDQIREELEAFSVSDSMEENAGAETVEDARVSLQSLMNRYSELMENECDWIQLAYYTVFDRDIPVKIVAINLKLTLSIKGNINLSVGAEMEYIVGKRYNFWIHCISRQAGSSEIDLVDERFTIQFYAMGTLGLRAGIKVDVGIGIISTKLGSIGANIEFGPYVKLWGYFTYIYSRSRPIGSDEWVTDREQSGALCFEFGLYVTVNFKAQLFNDTFKYEPTLYDGEFPILTVGERKNVYDFATVPDDEAMRIVDCDNVTSNGVTMQIPESYRKMKVIDLKTGEQSQALYDFYDFYFICQSDYFSVSDLGMVTVTPPADAEYLESDIKLVWKGSKLGVGVHDTAITIPIYWTNLTDTQMKEKHTASVAVGNPTDGYTTVWSDRFTRVETFDLPAESEILELIRYNSYFDENGINLKYGDLKGYTAASSGLTIKEDTQFYFDIDRQHYVVTVNGVQNPDGSLCARTYTGFYGDTLNFADLVETGTDNAESKTFTKFLKLTKPGNDERVDLQTQINLTFAEAYGTQAELVANYADNSAVATYTFDGIDAPTVTVKFKKGTTPNFTGLHNYVAQYGGEDVQVIGISPALEPVEHSLTYTVSCKKTVPTPKYTLTFETNGGSPISSQRFGAGWKIVSLMAETKRVGYTFAGWYTDPDFREEFDFCMPAEDTTIYAKWEALTFTVQYKSSYHDPVEKTIAYDQPYDLTPPEKMAEFKFLYWTLDGKEVTEGTIFNELKDVTLVAVWVEKKAISSEDIQSDVRQYTEVGPHPYEIILKKDYPDLDPEVPFVVKYKKVGSNEVPTAVVPSGEGCYDILVTRDTDENYKAFKAEYYAVLIIGKIDLNLTDLQVFVTGNTVVISRPEGYLGDGEITYRILQNGSSYSSNTTGRFTQIGVGTFECRAEVAEGTAYKAASISTTISKTTQTSFHSDFSVSLTICTSTEDEGGTNSTVAAYILDSVGSTFGTSSKELDGSFEKGKTDGPFKIITNATPWTVAGYRLFKGTGGLFPDWTVDWVDVTVSKGSVSYTIRDNQDYTYGGNTTHEVKMDGFKRELDLDPSFGKSTETAYLLDLQKDTYSYDFNGRIVDQYYPNGYQPMEYFDYPTYSVTADAGSDVPQEKAAAVEAALNRYIVYTGTTSFKIDLKGLRMYVQKSGIGDFDYIVSYTFPQNTTKNWSHTKTIHVDAHTQGVSNKTTKSTGAASCEMTAGNVETNVGKTVTVPVKINTTTPIWGVWANVEFDNSALEFAGFENGDMFTAEELTTQNNLSKSYFKFLVTNDELTNITANDTVLNLIFKVKETAALQAYDIKINVMQAVNVENQLQTMGTSNGSVNVVLPSYQVVFMNGDEVVQTLTVKHGEDAELPPVPYKEGHTGHWDHDGKNITSDLEIHAVYTINEYSVTIPTEQIGYKLETDVTTVTYGGSVTVSFRLDDGYSKTADFAMKVNGEKVELDEADTCVISGVDKDLVITVEGVEAKPHNCPSSSFTDLDTTAWYHEYTDFVLANGYMNGYPDNLFGPNDTMSRAMLIRIIYNLEGRPNVSGDITFTDVDAHGWYIEALLWATRNGIVYGYGDGKFGPNDPVTREQIAAIFYRYSKLKGYDLTQSSYSCFSDAGEVSEFAESAMGWAVGNGLLVGMEDGTLRPKNNSTRAEASAILKRFVEKVGK